MDVGTFIFESLPMKTTQVRWWLLLLEGLILLAFGFVAIIYPGLTLYILALAFGIAFLATGVIDLIHGFMGILQKPLWFLTLLLGILEIAVGAYLLSNPLITLGAFILVAGFLLLFRGIFELILAFSPHHGDQSRALVLISAVLGILAGIIILRYPVYSGVAFSWVMGVYALVAGGVLVALSFTLPSTKKVAKSSSAKTRKR